MQTQERDEFQNMKTLFVNQLDIRIKDDEQLLTDFPVLRYISDKNFMIGYIISKYHESESKDKFIQDIKKDIDKNFEFHAERLSFEVMGDVPEDAVEIFKLEEHYSDWTNQLIGHKYQLDDIEIVIPNKYGKLLMLNKNDKKTIAKVSEDIRFNDLIAHLLNAGSIRFYK